MNFMGNLKVSILGDSISTYEGYNPPEYAVFYNIGMTKKHGINSVYDTWWAKVNQYLKAYLCVNNSYSGSKVTGKKFPATSCEERLIGLRTAASIPDIILVYIGYNDWGNGIEIADFKDSYGYMLSEIKRLYQNAKIICRTLMRSTVITDPDWVFPERYAGTALKKYNDTIRRLCRKEKCFLADLEDTHLRYETLDGSHPTADGHITISNAWIRCLKNMKI